MNLILLFESDFIASSRSEQESQVKVCLTGRRAEYIQKIHQAKIGDKLSVGLAGGNIGTGTVININDSSVSLKVVMEQQPPPPLPVTLVLALPRPKVLRRLYRTISELGVKELYLINAFRVEKSYWHSPALDGQAIRDNLILGLEQCKDTVLPEVHLRYRFKPFVEDELPTVIGTSKAIVAHPHSQSILEPRGVQATTLVIGPEGGFIPYEIEKLEQAGCQTTRIGVRILRVETAVPAILSRLFSDG